jgi:hypothetical protein
VIQSIYGQANWLQYQPQVLWTPLWVHLDVEVAVVEVQQ